MTYIPNAIRPDVAEASILPRKNQEKRLLISSVLYQRLIVKRLAGMKPDSQNLVGNIFHQNRG